MYKLRDKCHPHHNPSPKEMKNYGEAIHDRRISKRKTGRTE